MWYEGNPCNMHLLDLAAEVREGVSGAPVSVGLRFNTVGVSDGISMGTDGMSYSLQSRDLIADSIETVMRRPVVRRQHLAPRLRQEHARLHHRHGAPRPARRSCLRRHDPSPALERAKRSTSIPPSRATASALAGSITDRGAPSSIVVVTPAPAPAPAAACTRQTRWPVRDRGDGHVLPYSSSISRHRSGQARRVPPDAGAAALRNLLEEDICALARS